MAHVSPVLTLVPLVWLSEVGPGEDGGTKMRALGQGRKWISYFWEAGNILWKRSVIGQFCNSGFWSHSAQLKRKLGFALAI